MRRSSSSSSISSQWSTFSDDLEIGQLTSIIPVNTTTTAATTITTATATSASNSSIISVSSAAASVTAASAEDMNMHMNMNMNMHDSHPPSAYERSRQGSTSSMRSCGGMSPDATKELWKTMLELQERYGCYTSARMDLAVTAGDIALSLMRKLSQLPL